MGKQSINNNRFHKGSVLVLVLIVVSAMTIVAFGLAYQTRIEIRLTKFYSQQAIIRNLAVSGLEAAKAILSEKELTAEHTASVCGFYPLKNTQAYYEQLTQPLNDQYQVVIWIEDEYSFLDLNKSDSSVWAEFSDFSDDIRACILDWIDTDSDVNPNGAESDYYQGLGTPYVCKNASLVSLKEIMFIKGVKHNDYFGDEFIKEIWPLDNVRSLQKADSILRQSFINTFTTFGQNTVNINTTPGAILSVLAGLDQQVADVIVAYRSGPDGENNTDDDRIFETTEDILNIDDLTELQKELLCQYCCFNSDTFRVFSLAGDIRQSCLLMATVKVTDAKPSILCLERLL